jgi:lipoyl(octanoyl) transferase
VQVNRAGGPTYHGPGQLVAYPVVRLAAQGRKVRTFVGALEEAIRETCDEFGAPAARRSGFPGVWSADGARKIASIGLAISRGVTLRCGAESRRPCRTRLDAIDPWGSSACASEHRVGIARAAPAARSGGCPRGRACSSAERQRVPAR